MSIRLNNDLLVDLGYKSLTPAQADRLLKAIYAALEFEVGLALERSMSDEQIAVFEEIIGANDEPAARKWLERNFPDHADVIRAKLEEISSELRKLATGSERKS